MNNLFLILTIISLIAILISLLFGVIGMVNNGAFNKKYSNLIMRIRIASQFMAIAFLLLYFFTK